MTRARGPFADAAVRGALRAALALACAALAGCNALFGPQGLFPSRANDYLEARPGPELRYPDGLEPAPVEPLYPLPERRVADALPERFELEAPEPLVSASRAPRLQSLAGRHWLIVDSSPVELWPQLRGALAVRGMAVSRLSPEDGSVTTAWAPAEDARRERYHFALGSGLRLGGSELRARQQFWRAGAADGWPERSDDRERERAMLLEIARGMAPGGLRPIASLIAQQVAQRPRMLLVDDGDQLRLEMELDYERGWALLNLALQKARVLVVDASRHAGQLYVKWLPARESRQGFWARLAGGGKSFEELRDAREELRLRLRTVSERRLALEARRSTPMAHDRTREFLLLIKGHMG